MLQFLFDTDHLTFYYLKHPPLMQRLAIHPADAVGICPINIEETMRGRLATLAHVLTGKRHVDAYRHLAAAAEMFRQFPLVPFDAGCEGQFQQLRAARLHVGTLDLKIAAIALTHGLTVLTRNRADFGRIPGLAVEDWSA
ncbi:MAG TPA: type II toxin-antitoxin system VapC family toxin [Gemmataceae bacterium]|nr:type II toxin-antitoxin system VapC family toxin [Gemmataceae bacterium]